MKIIKKFIAIIICLNLVLLMIPLSVFAEEGDGIGLSEDGEKDNDLNSNTFLYNIGDVIEFGSYPQSSVTDETLIVELENLDATWISYGYYSGNGYFGSMEQGKWMLYKDVIYNGVKYRGVYFKTYRPYWTGSPSTPNNSYQDDNGFYIDTTYWFEFQPLKWRVLDPETGLVMCDSIIDSQAFCNIVYCNNSPYYSDVNNSVYANDYSNSSIRKWLNQDFYNCAFTAREQNNIDITELDNRAYSNAYTQYDSQTTYDKVFLLSYPDILNVDYGFSSNRNSYDIARVASGTDYAKCQGLKITSGNSLWWLRSAGDISGATTDMYYDGRAGHETEVYNTSLGIRPAICLKTETDQGRIQYGADRLSFGVDISGYVGDVIDSLVVYTSANENIASLDITSSNQDVVEIGTIEIGVGDYITTSENEHIATIPLKLKAEGVSTITITSPEGVSESVIVTVSKKPEAKKSIAIFTTEKSLSVNTGDSMWLAFGLMDESSGLIDDDWKKMAVVVSDPTILSLSEYEKTEYGYALNIVGKKEGSTNVTISDTATGISTSIVISVYDKYIKSYSYSMHEVNEFYPNNKLEYNIKTNIYNLNGLYVNNYCCAPIYNSTGTSVGNVGETPKEFQVTFDVYNSRYYNGAVDIYDADGVWIGSEYIDRYSDVTSIRDTGEQLFFLISDVITGEIFTYEQASFSKKTSINIKVPNGGYFTISNNMSESPGTFFVNAFEILYDTTSDLIDFATSKSTDKTAFDKFYKEATKSFAQNVIDVRNESLSGEAKKMAMEVALNSLKSEIEKIQKKFIKSEAKDFVINGTEMYSDISTLAENVLNSYSVNWKHLYQSATGVGESMFIKFSGPAGVALKSMFAITKASNKLLMAAQMSRSLDNTYATFYSSIDEGYINPHGIVVNTNGNVDSEAVLQVFKVSDNDTLDVVLNSDNPLEKYELYNICLVKDDELVQPNGKVKVYVPIPDGMNGNTCKIYRQETDGSWTILDAHIEDNYLVFETNHFSLYTVIGDTINLSISSLPNKVSYNQGDVLDISGLSLRLNDQVITQGFICEPTVLSGIGQQTITVTYGCASVEFTVNVSASDSYNIIGDVNGDGRINNKDLSLLMQYVNGWVVEIDDTVADVNADGLINNKDLSLLMQYINGWEVVLG